MARKKKEKELEIKAQNEAIRFEAEPMFESEAYVAPQPEAGSDVTVLKPIGAGGPVPIVAPKHNTIQLQPIIVPLAVVPYMTQDCSVLMTETRAAQAEASEQAASFEAVEAQKLKKQRKVQPRIFGLVTFIFFAIALLPYILSLCVKSVWGIDIDDMNVVKIVQAWVEAKKFSWTPIENIAHVAVAALSAIGLIFALITIISGKYPRAFYGVLTALVALIHIAFLIVWLINGSFVLNESIPFVVVGGASLVNLVLVIIFSSVLNKLDDKSEKLRPVAREI